MGSVGATDGGAIGHAAIGQIGGRSIVLSHIGCISPSMQRQTQDALASLARRNMNGKIRHSRSMFALSHEPRQIADATPTDHIIQRGEPSTVKQGNEEHAPSVSRLTAIDGPIG
ncbi:hypothetical protein ACVILK_005015 [Bradyrhizobium embrapense]